MSTWPGKYVAAVASALGLASGASVSFLVTKKVLTKRFEYDLEVELEKYRTDYEAYQARKLAEANTLAKEQAAAAMEISGDEGYAGAGELPVGDEPVITKQRNVFADRGRTPTRIHEDVWNDEEETRLREENPGEPFVISHEEFMLGDSEYEQVGLTWYEGDRVLTDDKDVIIPPPEDELTLGVENLEKFGHGSRDPNIVYIRNEAREIDFEVARHSGEFAQVVHGFVHSEDERPARYRRMRRDRE